jgi:DNA-directed RNA polymerase subunit M/transcription elongation factor TFIIS
MGRAQISAAEFKGSAGRELKYAKPEKMSKPSERDFLIELGFSSEDAVILRRKLPSDLLTDEFLPDILALFQQKSSPDAQADLDRRLASYDPQRPGSFLQHGDLRAENEMQDEVEKALLDADMEVIEGVYHCGNCKSQRVVALGKQTRSADEGMTVFYRCVSCRHRWKES